MAYLCSRLLEKVIASKCLNCGRLNLENSIMTLLPTQMYPPFRNILYNMLRNAVLSCHYECLCLSQRSFHSKSVTLMVTVLHANVT